LVEETVDGDSALVQYESYYADGTTKLWTDTLFREDAIWRVAPHYTRSVEQ
jgi:hypothetical protein